MCIEGAGGGRSGAGARRRGAPVAGLAIELQGPCHAAGPHPGNPKSQSDDFRSPVPCPVTPTGPARPPRQAAWATAVPRTTTPGRPRALGNPGPPTKHVPRTQAQPRAHGASHVAHISHLNLWRRGQGADLEAGASLAGEGGGPPCRGLQRGFTENASQSDHGPAHTQIHIMHVNEWSW